MNIPYQENLSAIDELSSELANWIEKGKNEDWIRRAGNQVYVRVSGYIIPVYTEDDPLKDVDILESIKLHKENVTVFIGMGLGHVVYKALCTMEKGHRIIVIEPVSHFVRLAFSCYDFSKYIKEKTLLITPGKSEISLVIGFMEAVKVTDDWNILENKVAIVRSEYADLKDYTFETLNQVRCNTNTISSAGTIIANNDIITLPYVIRHRGIAELLDLYKGKPAICISTGPSLSRNIHLLRDVYQNKSAILIAVGQALRPLLAYDIIPDFICSVDYGEVNMTHYAGLCDEQIPLVTINKTYALLLKQYKGPKFISAAIDPGYGESTHSVLKDKGMLPQGGSVSHMAFGLAIALGCDPVMFVGQDLALTEKSHFNQVDSGGNVTIENGQIVWKVYDPRSKLLHNRDDLGMGIQQFVPGYFGDQVLTNTGLLTFLTAMENLVSQFSNNTILNCTEGGAHIKGTKRIFLSEALEKYCQKSIDKSVINPLLSLADNANELIEQSIPLFKSDIEKLDSIIKNSKRGIKVVQKMRTCKDPVRLQHLLYRNAKFSENAHKAARKLPTISLAIYWASRKIQSREMNVAIDDEDTRKLVKAEHRKNLLIRLDRNEFILKATHNTSSNMKKIYEESLKILNEYRETGKGLEPTGETNPPDLNDAEDYFSVGNFARPLLEAKRIFANAALNATFHNEIAYDICNKAIKLRDQQIEDAKKLQATDREARKHLIPQYLDLIEESRKLGKEEDRFEEAITMLKQAVEMMPEREEAAWGLASALYHNQKYQESADHYYMLVQNYPDTPRYKIELGQVLLKGRNRDGFQYIKEAMAESDEFNGYYGRLAEWYVDYDMKEEAMQAAEEHMKRNPHDIETEKLLAELRKG